MRYYLAMWDCDGFEYLADITEFHPDEEAKTVLFDSIKAGHIVQKTGFPPITAMKLRARFNVQRNYGIYVFTSDDSIGLEDLMQWSKSDPQGLVNWIREHHTQCIFESKPEKRKAIQ